MRIAAVAFVLIVGAAVVLAFANTLNSWVVGGLLGGLAAILLSIPISLALFTLLARRQEARQRSHATDESYEDEREFADDYDGRMIYSAEGYLVPEEDDDYEADLRARATLESRRIATSNYLALPPARQGMTSYDDEEDSGILPRHDPRNYPRQSRQSVRPVEPEYTTLAQPNQPRSSDGSRRDLSTRSLAQHQSAAIRQASQEAQRQATNRRSGSSTRREQENRSRALQRPRTSHDLRPPSPPSPSKRPLDEYETRLTRSQNVRPNWNEEDMDDDFEARSTRSQEQYQQYPRSASYPRNPRAPRPGGPQNSYHEDDYQQNQPQSRRTRRDPDPDRLSGNLRDPLVRRAPYLYDDDPMRHQLARQIDPERPITRRSSLNERYEDDEY